MGIKIRCPKCNGCKGIYGKSAMGYPATLPCPRYDASGEVRLDSLTEEEQNEIKD
jgi:hypothetical protein